MNTRAPLTRRQKQVLEYIVAFREREGIPPTVREIAVALNVTGATTHGHLRTLQEKGYLKRRDRVARGLEIVSEHAPLELGPSSERIPRLEMQPPFRARDLLGLDSFIIHCDQLGILTGKRQLEYFDREGILLPAVRVNPGYSSFTDERDGQKYYRNRPFSYGRKGWLERARKEGLTDYPAETEFSDWFKRGLVVATRPGDLNKPYLRFYARNQCFAMRAIQPILTTTIHDPRCAVDERDWIDLGRRIRNALPLRLLTAQKTILQHYKWMKLMNRVADIRDDVTRRGADFLQRELDGGDAESDAKKTAKSHIKSLEARKCPPKLRGIIAESGFSKSELKGLHNQFAHSSREVDPNYQWPGYVESLPEALRSEARDHFRLAGEYYDLATSVEWVLSIIGAAPRPTRDLLAGSAQSRYCVICTKRFKPRNRRHCTCSEKCSRKNRNKQKRDQRKLREKK